MSAVPTAAIDGLAAICGLVCGSFFNVLIWRLPRGESILWPASHCPMCSRPIKPTENIPVLSFLLLRGRCAGCAKKIPVQYPMVEALTAVLAVILWHNLILPRTIPAGDADVWEIIHLSLWVATLILMVPVMVIDLKHLIIPNSLTFPGIIVSAVILWLPVESSGPAGRMLGRWIGELSSIQQLSAVHAANAVLGAVVGGGTLVALNIIGTLLFIRLPAWAHSRFPGFQCQITREYPEEAMGGGDVKLMIWIGLLFGPWIAAGTILFGAFLGAVVGIALKARNKLRADHTIPFGPFLAAGLWITVLTGSDIARWYLSLGERIALRFFLP